LLYPIFLKLLQPSFGCPVCPSLPHGIYDLKKNSAYINIGTNYETAEFACDSIKTWWNKQWKNDYKKANSILMLVDSGGSNSYRHYIFKEELQKLVNEIGIEIRVAHYPPYCSKWNPIEHRLFPHVTRAMQGVPLKSHNIAKQLIEKTTTTTGLQVAVNVIRKVYEKGKKVADDFKQTMKIKFDKNLGQWNYKVLPIRE
jgi:Rhodopirellula transposase DDE domain